MSIAPTRLETGWEDTTPVSDTLIRRYLHNHADYMDAVAGAAAARVHRTAAYAAADLGRPAGVYNSATLLQPLLGGDLDAVLDELEAFYSGGSGTVMLWSAWPTPDLRARGWQLEGHPPLLVRPPGGPLPAAGDVRVEPVRDADGVRAWEHVATHGFPFDDAAPHLPGAFLDERILTDRRLRLWLAFDGDRPVSAAALFVAHGIGQLAMGVTLPDARRKGHWYALVRERLLAAPNLVTASLFSDDSRPGAERVGFLPVWRFTLWSRRRP